MLKTGNELFSFRGKSVGYQLSDFWSWQASDLLSNTLRGVLAEFIVAKALDIKIDTPRIDWIEYDLLLKKKKIEVKTSAYLQSWSKEGNSKPTFSIRPARAWTPEFGYVEPPRHADLYVFCLNTEREWKSADSIDLDKWKFYPVLTSKIEAKYKEQKTIGLKAIEQLCQNYCDYSDLKHTVSQLLKELE